MLLQSFPYFPRLPPELRSNIWRLALRQPRVHRLRIATPDINQPLMLQPTETLPRSTITTRTILATCTESRAEALRAVPHSLPLGDCILRFNGYEDIICLTKVDLEVLARVNAELAEYHVQFGGGDDGEDLAGKGTSPNWLREVRKLAFEVRSTDFHSAFGFSTSGMKTDHMRRFVAEFTGLEWLFLVPLPSPDDMETVKCRESRLATSLDSDTDESTDEEDDEGYEEGSNNEVDAMSEDDGGTLRGGWIRGENGLSDWYCWVPSRAKWTYSNEVVEVHFWDMIDWRDCVKSALSHPSDPLEPSHVARKAPRSVKVEVMIHFREGVEPPHEL